MDGCTSVANPGEQTEHTFTYDSNGNVTSVQRSTVEYVYMGRTPIAKIDTVSNYVYYYHNDRLGTPKFLTDENGFLVWSADYLPFGEATVKAGRE